MDPKVFVPNYERPYFYTRTPLPPPPLQPPATAVHQPHGFNLNYKVSPSVLLIIIILAMIFFIFGLVHLLVRHIMRPYDRDPHEFDNVTALQGQLQQLFHLHDSGVDQCFIDKLPVLSYKSITGVRDPFDCAVCLCEFKGEDMLRLLPNCSHAFHMDCIDTWLLSHSTCPLCRDSLLSDCTPNSSCSPIVLVLESIDTSREIGNTDRPRSSSIERANSHLSNEEFEFDKDEKVNEDDNKEKIVTIKLGKFKNVDGCCGGGDVIGGSSEKQTIDGRRCYSMGTLEYVMNDNSSLQVLVKTQVKKQASKKSCLPITPSHRPAMSECGGDSRRDFKGIEVLGSGSGGCGGANCKSKRDSFSISKVWLSGKKEKASSTLGAAIGPSIRGPFSFHFDLWEDDQETQSCQWMDPPPLEASNPPSFRKSLHRLMGWQQSKVVHSSSSTNVSKFHPSTCFENFYGYFPMYNGR